MSLIDDVIKKNKKEEENRARKRELAQRAPMGPVQPKRFNTVTETSSGISVKSSPFDYSEPTVTVARSVPQPSLKVVGAYGTPPPVPSRKSMAFGVGEGLSGVDQEKARAAIELSIKNTQEVEALKKKIKPSTTVDNFTKQAIPMALRAMPRAAISLQSTFGSKSLEQNPTMGKIKTPYGDEYIAKSPAAKFIFGTDPIGTVGQEGNKLADLAAAGGIKYAEWKDKTKLSEEDKLAIFNDTKKYKWLTLPLGLLSVGSDLIPGVGGAKKAVTKEVVEQLVKKYGLETANEIIEKGGKELAEQAIKKESKEFLTDFTLGDAGKLSEVSSTSFLNNPENKFKKPNRLQEGGVSLKEAKTGLAENGQNLPGRIVFGKNDNGDIILKDGTHLLEAYRVQNLNIPNNKVTLEDGVSIDEIQSRLTARRSAAENTPALPETAVSRRGVITSAKESASPQIEPQTISRQAQDGLPTSPEAIRQSSGDYSLDKVVKDNDPILAQTRRTVKEMTADNRASLALSAKLVPGELNSTNIPLYKKVRNSVGEVVQKLRETVEDSRIRLKNLQRADGVVLPDDIDPYNAYKLFIGRVSERIDDVTAKIKNIDKQIVKAGKKSGVDDRLISEDVNDYLIARHAPERNKELGDTMAAGITDEQAAKIVARIEAQPNFKEIKKAADEVADVNKQTLEVLRDGGVISPVQYKKLTTAYKNHVPLNRIFEDDEDFARVLASRGMDVKQTGLIRAKGSTRDIADVMQNVADNAKAAIVRAEKNKADLELLAFARANKDTGLFTEIPYNKARKGDESVLFFFENGKHKALKINDPLLASAIKGTNMQHLPAILKFVHTFTRLMSSLATRYNPEFLLPNKIRDLQELMVFTAAQKDIGFKTAGKAALKDPGSIKDIYNYMRGIDTPGARLYKQMRLDGGSTGGLALSTKKASELDMAKLKKLNRSKPRQALEATFAGIDHANQIIEDSTRLSVYKTALEKGLSRKQAAVLAKDATIDFNKMGTGGPIINALYMFSNASIQGSAKTLRSMKNPKVAATVLLTVGTTTTLVNQYNDNIDEDWRSKVPEWDRFNNLVVLVPSNEGVKYAKLPVSWGLKPFKVASDYMYDLSTRDDITIGKALEGTVAATVDAYNPLGGTDLMSTVTPTALDVPMDIRGNRAWHGGKIKPDYDPNSPEALKYYKSLLTTPSGRRFEDITSWLYKKTGGKADFSPADLDYAFKQYIGGTGRFISRSVTTINSIGKGELPPANESPITNRFYGSKSAEEVGDELMPKIEFYKVKSDITAKEMFSKKGAEKLYDEIMQIQDVEKRKARVQEEIRNGNTTAEDLFKVFKKKSGGLDDFETAFKSSSLSVRAAYLKRITADMNADEKRNLIKQLTEKKLLTPDLIREFLQLSK